MNATLEACLRSWSFDPSLYGGLLVSCFVYLRGVSVLKRRGDERHTRAQTVAFAAAMATILIALCSPIDTFSSLLLSVHMIQHLLLMIAAPILIWCARPNAPFELGLPRPVLETWIVPLRRTAFVRGTLRWLERPIIAWCLFAAAMWGWHFPAAYDLALRSDAWHRVEHLTFLLAGILFWRPVIAFLLDERRPAPALDGRNRTPYWLLPYLFLTDLQGTVLSAVLTFSGRVLYPHYAAVPRIENISPLADQLLAGSLMWVLGSAAFLIPLAWIGFRLLSQESPRVAITRTTSTESPGAFERAGRDLAILDSTESSGSIRTPTAAFDLLRTPGLGWLLRSRNARLALRGVMLVAAAAIVVDGLTGPQVPAMNLAGVLPWIHWRGLAVFGLLAAGNVVCMGCPLALSRGLWRRFAIPRWSWPRPLRNKWTAVALLVGFFVAYEVFDLWASPWWTAWIIVAYFCAAAAIDALFERAAFCKYVCPIGQFQFATAHVAPWEVRVREPAGCAGCDTHDCLRGSASSPGCEFDLFLPRKSGNLDCTLCLACVDACPRDNIGLLATSPFPVLSHDGWRAGIGRLSRRLDVAALVAVFSFAAFANAAGMIAPVVRQMDRLAEAAAWPLWVIEMPAILIAVVVLPAILLLAVTALDRSWGGFRESLSSIFARSCWALVPLAVGMWTAHYGFHFLMGIDAFIAATQRFAADWSIGLGTPDWRSSCCAPVGDGVLKFEILALGIGFVTSLYLGYRIALDRAGSIGPAVLAFLPWAGLLTILFSIGIWIVFQPMEMRGMLPAGGGM